MHCETYCDISPASDPIFLAGCKICSKSGVNSSSGLRCLRIVVSRNCSSSCCCLLAHNGASLCPIGAFRRTLNAKSSRKRWRLPLRAFANKAKQRHVVDCTTLRRPGMPTPYCAHADVLARLRASQSQFRVYTQDPHAWPTRPSRTPATKAW